MMIAAAAARALVVVFWLASAAYAFLLYRYAVSDHLPVLLNYTI